MEQKIKICSDGFVWLVVSHEQARKLYKADVISLFTLYSDDSEAMIESEEKLKEAVGKGLRIGIEVGFIPKLSTTNGRQ